MTGDPGQENCGFELAEEPSEPPVNPCSDGTLVFGPETFSRAQGQPLTEFRPFSAPEPGGVCILVQNSGVSAAWIGVDGVDIIKPNRFNPHISVLSAMANVSAGEHELSVRLASKPGSELTVEVWFAPVDVTPRDKVVGDESKVAVWSLYDTPDPFSPGDQDGVEDTTSLSAMVGVMHLGRVRNSTYKLRYTFEIADQADCVQIRAIEGEVPLDPSVVLDGFMVAEEWDGTKDNGDPVPEGNYYYRLVAEILKEDPGGGIELVDYVASRIQKVTVDNTPFQIRRLDFFLAANDLDLATEDEGGLFIRWHYTDTPKLMWGVGVEFDLEDAGCLQTDLFEKVRCYLASYHDLFGYGENTEHLLDGYITTLYDGRKIVRFHQHLFGAPISGADVIVTVTSAEDAITRIHSSFVRGVTTNPVESEDDLFPPPEITRDILDEVESQINSAITSFTDASPVFLIDQPNKSTTAIPRFAFDVKTVDSLWYRVFMNIGERIIEIRRMSKNYPDPEFGNHVLTSSWVHPDYTDTSCIFDSDCTSAYDERYSCYKDLFLSDTCVIECSEHTDCWDAFDPHWNCIKTDGGFKGYCQRYSEEAGLAELFNLREGPQASNGWWDDYYNNYYFERAERLLDDWTDYLWQILGRQNLNDCQGTTTVNIQKCFEEKCPGARYNYGGEIHIYGMDKFDGEFDDTDNLFNRYHLMGHEGGHALHYNVISTGDPCNPNEIGLSADYCMSEDLANLSGALFSRYRLPTETWNVTSGSCPDGYCTLSAWYDQTCGLVPCPIEGTEMLDAYSHRSRYDWLPCQEEEHVETDIPCSLSSHCPPYLICKSGFCIGRNYPDFGPNKNTTIWSRFARILAKGSSTFVRDRTGENLGISFSGVGNNDASRIIYEGFTNLTEFIDPITFAEILASAGHGLSTSKGLVTILSLNAAGFPVGAYFLHGGVVSDRAIRAITYSNWTMSSNKAWYIYKDKYTYRLIVRYGVGTNLVTNIVAGAQTESAPTAVVFNGILHIFWHERGTNSIKLIAVDESGNWSPVQDLSGLDMVTSGGFDVTIFQGDLYIGFVRPDAQRLWISRCLYNEVQDTGYCTDDSLDWKGYPYRIKDTGLPTIPGVAITAGPDVNGSVQNHLYAFLCDPTDNRLSVARINVLDETVDYRLIHNTNPSYQANVGMARGIEIRHSAFPEASRYLYLVWNDMDASNPEDTDDRIYTSILQNWIHFGWPPQEERAWFTRPVKIGVSSRRGITFWRHNADESVRHIFISSEDGNGYYNSIWGRY